jgi:FKBP-type peptidyl-prolyl cis-trans isomerase FklB
MKAIAKTLTLITASLFTLSAIAATSIAAPAKNTTQTSMNTLMDKLSYTMGVKLGENLKQQGVNLNPTMLAAGLKDALQNKTLALSNEQMNATIAEFQKSFMAQKQQQMSDIARQNAQEGEAFLQANAKRPGVKVLANGLQYKIISAGAGAAPTLKDQIVVNYTGSFINNTVFDSTAQRGPATLALAQVIPAWQQILPMMQPGAVWEVYVPANLAYGAQGAGPIGPNKTLIFKIQLVSVKK